MDKQKRFPFFWVFLVSIIFALFGVLWAINTQIEASLTRQEIIGKSAYYGLEGFVAVWILSGIGWWQYKKRKKGR